MLYRWDSIRVHLCICAAQTGQLTQDKHILIVYSFCVITHLKNDVFRLLFDDSLRFSKKYNIINFIFIIQRHHIGIPIEIAHSNLCAELCYIYECNENKIPCVKVKFGMRYDIHITLDLLGSLVPTGLLHSNRWAKSALRLGHRQMIIYMWQSVM